MLRSLSENNDVKLCKAIITQPLSNPLSQPSNFRKTSNLLCHELVLSNLLCHEPCYLIRPLNYQFTASSTCFRGRTFSRFFFIGKFPLKPSMPEYQVFSGFRCIFSCYQYYRLNVARVLIIDVSVHGNISTVLRF